ncbi:hypothetical protein AD945_06325 [Gluconobacter albidus]|uniref:Uncharacterized protein n=1 Tax=Gluconobacter albidus TaxID=318683 RepID=A0A149TK47_9PROT|nr:hypothetical protein AD945_06325 [Gluconobacter albidus]
MLLKTFYLSLRISDFNFSCSVRWRMAHHAAGSLMLTILVSQTLNILLNQKADYSIQNCLPFKCHPGLC